jgi:RNase H-fold protein (predicted Holliday junction resolvase)
MPSPSIDNILSTANDIVNNRSEEKTREYGDFTESMEKTAALASIMSNKEITVTDAFNVMIALKLARESHKHKQDNLLDAVAYMGALDNYLNGK